MDKKTKNTTSKNQTTRTKRSSKQKDSVSRAKKDARNFAKSVASFIPGIGTLLGIQNAYDDGMKLLESAPQAMIDIGNRSKERLESRIKRRLSSGLYICRSYLRSKHGKQNKGK